MLDLASQTHQEPQVLNDLALKGALWVVEAPLQFPMPEGTVLGAVVMLPLLSLGEVSVVNLLAAVVRMEEICPRDDHQDDVGLRLEGHIRVVKDLHCRKRCFAG